MRFNDLKKEVLFSEARIKESIDDVLKSGQYFFGEQTESLENTIASFVGKKYGIAVKNGTDALMLSLKHALRIKGLDAPVVLPNFGAYPTAVACRNLTDNLHYVDVDESLTIDCQMLPEVTGGVVVIVNLFGNNCDFKQIKHYCETHDHLLIEDCAQSLGSRSGIVGDYSVFSFYPTKPLGCNGDGGMICVNEGEKREYFKRMRFYGQDKNGIQMVGVNSRIDEIQAGILNAKFVSMSRFNQMRKSICETHYNEINKSVKWGSDCIYHQYVALFNDREKMVGKLNAKKIPFLIHYPKHVNEMECLIGRNASIVGRRISDKCISLPCHPFLSLGDIETVVGFLRDNRGEFFNA